jgi:hypothetical protein
MTDQQSHTADLVERSGAGGRPAMTPRELYRFDVQGFLVVKDALTSDEVARLNEAIDANQDKLVVRHPDHRPSGPLAGTNPYEAGGMFEWPKPWCDPFRALIAHPRGIGYLNALLGRGWRLDHRPEYFQAPKGSCGLGFHLGEYFHTGSIFYNYKAGQIRSGLTVLQWVLADQGGELGGFACIPGSHKANFPRPQEISGWLEDRDMFVCPAVSAGDLIIFSEATTHGAFPWNGEHDRRVILHRYTPGYVQFSSAHGDGPAVTTAYFTYQMADWVGELDEAARAALEPATIRDRPLINDDGSVERGDILLGDAPPFSYDYGPPAPNGSPSE